MKKMSALVIIFVLSSFGKIQSAENKYWIFFTDKGKNVSQIELSLSKIRTDLPDKVLKRRSKTCTIHDLVDRTDLPLYQPYLEKLNEFEIKPIVKSKWLNAISVKLTDRQLSNVKSLSFIKKIQPVVIYKRRPVDETKYNDDTLGYSAKSNTSLNYGPSLSQNNLIHVADVHQLGINGQGVLIGILDSGFKHDVHESLIDVHIVGEYDFINNDNVTQNETNDNDVANQHNHGTEVLSVIGGYQPGSLIGPAFGAEYMLGKTEYIPTETIIEEDYWVAGLEWMEENGADIVTSSLGYTDWYQYSDMDGNTAITTIAADLAAKKGVIVVNSNGNEADNFWKYMTAPADGDSVIGVGAVYSNGQITSFSSLGPTYDGRIKPDVVAMGSGVYAASTAGSNSYKLASGTSYSTPQVAGVAALILTAHPYLTPMQVRDALRETADKANNPDNQYGWGLINAYQAIFYHGFFFDFLPKISNDTNGHKIEIHIFSRNPIKQEAVFLYYSIDHISYTPIPLTVSTEENIFESWIPFQPMNTEIQFYLSAMDNSGNIKYHPYAAPDEIFTFFAFDTTVNPGKKPELPATFILHQNYPNPFNNYTTIRIDVLFPSAIELSIYNVRGQLIKSFKNNVMNIGIYPYHWNGVDNNENAVASGVYMCKVKSNSSLQVKKLVLLR